MEEDSLIELKDKAIKKYRKFKTKRKTKKAIKKAYRKTKKEIYKLIDIL